MKFIELTSVEIAEIKSYFISREFPERITNSESKKEFKRKCSSFEIIGDCFYHKDDEGGMTRFFANDDARSKLLAIKAYHNIGHRGRDKIEFSIKPKFMELSGLR